MKIVEAARVAVEMAKETLEAAAATATAAEEKYRPRQREAAAEAERSSRSTSIWRHRFKRCWWPWQEWSQESYAQPGRPRQRGRVREE